jgi:hypothetical protein
LAACFDLHYQSTSAYGQARRLARAHARHTYPGVHLSRQRRRKHRRAARVAVVVCTIIDVVPLVGFLGLLQLPPRVKALGLLKQRKPAPRLVCHRRRYRLRLRAAASAWWLAAGQWPGGLAPATASSGRYGALLLWVASPRWPLTNSPTSRRSSCCRNAKLICNGHGVCGTYVPHHCSHIVVWTHSNDCVAIHTHVGYEMGRYTS